MRRAPLIRATVLAITGIAFVASNWASMNVGFEYGSDVGGCIAFSMMTELPADEITMCPRAKDSPLLPARKLWLKMTDDEVVFEESDS